MIDSSSSRKALVIGGSGGIGSAIVSHLRMEGLCVDAPSHQELDVSSGETIRSYFQRKPEDYSIVVYSAGINNICEIEKCSEVGLLDAIQTNTFGFVSVVQHCIPHMRQHQWGRIVAISSLYGIFSRRMRLPYAISKHGLTGAIQTIALETACDGILVNSVVPGFVLTQMTLKNNNEERIAQLERNIPVGRMATGDDIACIVKFLCSEENSYITGQNVVIDGGYSIGGWQNE